MQFFINKNFQISHEKMVERGEPRGKLENIHGRCGEISPPAIYRGTTNCASSFDFQVYFTDLYLIVQKPFCTKLFCAMKGRDGGGVGWGFDTDIP